MGRIKKKLPITVAEADVEFEHSVDALTQAISENLEQYPNGIEPFDAYAQRVRAQIHSNIDDFRYRFLEGYSILIKELEKEQKKPSQQSQGPFIM